MLLAVDIGNSIVNCGLFKGEKLTAKWSFPTGGEIQLRRKNVTAAIISSVVPKVTKIVKKNLDIPVLEVSEALNLGFKIRYKNPKKVGADRLANASAARNLYGMPALIVDFGTATTIDVISHEGDYLGGVILPGVDMIRKGLNSNTALLPLVSLKRPKRILGQDTVSAMRSGIYYGFCGMIKQLLIGLKKELRFPKKTVIIATGGYAKFFAKGVNAVINKDLTLQGLRLIYEREIYN